MFKEIDASTAAQMLSNALMTRGKVLSVAESITGGLIGTLITDIPGSSKIFWGSLVTYSDASKQKILGIKKDTIHTYGAVSKKVVEEMVERAMELAESDISLSVSGFAGGNGDESENTGLVWIGVKLAKGRVFSRKFNFTGSRGLIRRKTAIAGILLTETALRQPERLDSCSSWQYS